MPIYAYEPTIFSEDEKVNDCCYFETLQKMRDEALTHCPTCGHQVHRAISTFSLGSSTPERAIRSGEQSGIFQKPSTSAAGRAANLATRHVCGGGCRH